MIPAAHSRAHQRFLKMVLVRIGIMRVDFARALKIAFPVFVRHFAMREIVADARC